LSTNKATPITITGPGNWAIIKTINCKDTGCVSSGSVTLGASTEDIIVCQALAAPTGTNIEVIENDKCIFLPSGVNPNILPKFSSPASERRPALVFQAAAAGTLLAPPSVAKRSTLASTLTVNFLTDKNTPPVANNLVAIAPAPVVAGTAFAFTIPVDSFTDADVTAGADTLTFSLDEAPTWSVFNSATRVLSGTPAIVDVGKTLVVVRVTDGTGKAATREFFINISPPANLITSTTDAVLAAGKTWSSDYLFLTGYFDIVKVCVTPKAGSVTDLVCTGDFEGGVLGNEITGTTAFCTYCRQIKHGETLKRKRAETNTQGGFRVVAAAGADGATFSLSAQSILPKENIVNFNVLFANLGKFIDA
jgi:hypothetical protein